MTEESFAYINRVYWDSFGPSKLDVFLDTDPPKEGRFLWYTKRRVAQTFVFLYYPFFILSHIWGVVNKENDDLLGLAFDIALFCHSTQNCMKMAFWLLNLPAMRSICLDFSKFHVAQHRPILTTWVLEKESRDIRKLVRRCYMISYCNILFWCILPTSVSFIRYMLDLMGSKELQPTYIPRYSPANFSFDMTKFTSRLLLAILEIPVFSIAFIYFQPIDMFFATVINMAQVQFRVLNAALFEMPEDLKQFWDIEIPIIDKPEPMSMALFIKDHQFMIRYGVRLRKVLNPILGLVTINSIIVICNMTILALLQFKRDMGFLDLMLPTTASILVIITCLYVFYTFTSMTGILKDAEESVFHALMATKWYEKSFKERKTMIFMQQQSMNARKIRSFGVGNMGRDTFIDGLRMIYSFYNFMQRFIG